MALALRHDIVMTIIGRNILRYAREKGMTLADVAAKAGIAPGHVSKIVNQGDNYTAASLQKVSQALGVPLGALFSEGPQPYPATWRRIPVLTEAQILHWNVDNRPLMDIHQGKSVMTTCECSERTFAYVLTDDSMAPSLNEGDRVTIDPGDEPKPGQYVLAIECDERVVLRQYASRAAAASGEPVFELIPRNDFFPRLRSDEQKLTLLGVAVERVQLLP